MFDVMKVHNKRKATVIKFGNSYGLALREELEAIGARLESDVSVAGS